MVPQPPDLELPDIQLPDIQLPDIQLPDIQLPDLQDLPPFTPPVTDPVIGPPVVEPPVPDPPAPDSPVSVSPVPDPPVFVPRLPDPPATYPPVTDPPLTVPIPDPPVLNPPVVDPPATVPPDPTTAEVPDPHDASESSAGGIPVLVFGFLVALLLSAGLIHRAHRRRGIHFVKAHVTVAPRPGSEASFEAQPGDGADRDHVFTVVPAEIRRTTTIEENFDDRR